MLVKGALFRQIALEQYLTHSVLPENVESITVLLANSTSSTVFGGPLLNAILAVSARGTVKVNPVVESNCEQTTVQTCHVILKRQVVLFFFFARFYVS